jgi:hypothetical protein
MRTILMACIALAASLAGAETAALPTGGAGWFGDPMTWRFREDGVRCAVSNGHGIAVYEAAPLASNVTVEAVFTPAKADAEGWNIASVAIVEDARNFWHVALVEAPEEHGLRHGFEVCEMRGGEWLAQGNLKQEQNEEAAGGWAFGRPYRLGLSLDRDGITGTVKSGNGTLLLRRRFAFTAPAVRRGRPAIRVGGITGRFTDIRAGWSEAAAETAPRPAFPPYDVPDIAPDIRGKATGFFRVEQKPDGRWWAIDPLGRGTVLLGVDHVTFWGHWCEKLGYHPHERKNRQKYADKAQWETETLERLKRWGFNTLGAGCDPALKHRGLIHTEFLNIGDHLASLGDEYDITPNERRPCSSFPNVFHPDFEAYCRYVARLRCAPNRDDPWLFGYFIDNELAWWGRGAPETGLFDAVMKKGAAHSAKAALRDFLAERCDRDTDKLNAAFGTALKDFDALLALDALPHGTPVARDLKRAFLEHVAERYFSVAAKAIREADPNHIVMGARFAGTWGTAPVVWEVSGRHCEVVTFNFYPMADLDENRVYSGFGRDGEPITEHFAKYHGYVNRPMLITEWSFPALDAGLPSIHGAGQRFRTQAERTRATELFAKTMLSLPFLLGYDYFMWVDEPALGISTPFPEDSNYGLINEDGVPYPAITEMFAALHRDAGAWRLKPAPEAKAVTRKTPPPPLEVARRAAAAAGGAQAAHFTREGDAFRAGNGRLTLTGRIGARAMVERVALDGEVQDYGRYSAMLMTHDAEGRNRWTETHTVKAVEGRVEDGIAVIEITGEGAAGEERFEVTHRLFLPPGSPWFIAEAVHAKNTGSAPLKLRSLYFRLNNAFTSVPDKLPPNLWGVPPSGCWLDAAGQRFFGALAARSSGIQIYFWLNPQGGQHPDARLELEETPLAPGAAFLPDEPAYVLCVAGRGDGQTWMDSVESLKRLTE